MPDNDDSAGVHNHLPLSYPQLSGNVTISSPQNVLALILNMKTCRLPASPFLGYWTADAVEAFLVGAGSKYRFAIASVTRLVRTCVIIILFPPRCYCRNKVSPVPHISLPLLNEWFFSLRIITHIILNTIPKRRWNFFIFIYLPHCSAPQSNAYVYLFWYYIKATIKKRKKKQGETDWKSNNNEQFKNA